MSEGTESIVRWMHASTGPPYANFPHASTPPPSRGGHSRGCMIFTIPPDSAAVYYFLALVAEHATFVRLGCFPKATTLPVPIAALSIVKGKEA
jgi:hypothetical protein